MDLADLVFAGSWPIASLLRAASAGKDIQNACAVATRSSKLYSPCSGASMAAARYSRGETPVQRLKARVKLEVSAKPSR